MVFFFHVRRERLSFPYFFTGQHHCWMYYKLISPLLLDLWVIWYVNGLEHRSCSHEDAASLRAVSPAVSLITLIPQGLQEWGSPHCPLQSILPASSIKTPSSDCHVRLCHTSSPYYSLPILHPHHCRIYRPSSLCWDIFMWFCFSLL